MADEPTDAAKPDAAKPDAAKPDAAKPDATTARRPNPAASAASRARRIGGTPAARPQPKEPVAPTTELVSTSKQETAKPVKATKPTKPAKTPTAVTMSKTETAASDKKAGSDKTAGTTAPVATQVPEWLRWVPAIALTVCAVAMIALVAVSSHGVWWAKTASDTQRDKVLAAAKRCTALANTYKYTTIAADQARGLACTTGDWTAQYKSAMQKIVKPTATKLKASQSVQINTAGVESIADHGAQWTVILYGQTSITQSGAAARVDPFSAIVRMDRVKGNYLVSKIDLITNPSS